MTCVSIIHKLVRCSRLLLRDYRCYPGTAVPLNYESKDYAGNGGTVSKTAYVYLPYGYDENDTDTKYDVIYLMHGWGGEAGQYLQGEGAVIKNMLDHMIENGEVKPVIAVSPSFYHDGSGTDFSSSVAAFRAFYQEFENDLMPAVEGAFHVFDGLPHGFGLGAGTVAEGWINNAVAFWERQMNKR